MPLRAVGRAFDTEHEDFGAGRTSDRAGVGMGTERMRLLFPPSPALRGARLRRDAEQHDENALSGVLVEDEVLTRRRHRGKRKFLNARFGRYEGFHGTAPEHTTTRVDFENIK